MSFKDDYRRYNEKIKPDKEFLDKLADDITKERRSRISYRRGRIISVASVACVCLVTVLGFTVSMRNSQDINISVEGAATTSASEVTNVGAFEADLWYSEDMSDKEIIALLASRLADSNDMEKVYCSDDNSFDDDELLSDNEIKHLYEKLLSAEVSSVISESNNAKHYMLVFENGDIVKLTEDSGYIIFEDTGCFYKIK